MGEYDFHQLSDKEFEAFCCDLLSLHLGSMIERFKPGRDSGVDGRFFSPDGEVILQCKHWVSTPLGSLLSSLERVEAPKVEKLGPSRYLVAVSNPLSRTDKKKIFEIFSPFLKTPSDVFGREDLNDLLAKYPEIERKHYKLWISSSSVLSTLLNAPIIGRSDFLIHDIVQDSVRYVLTDNHRQALSKLESKRVVIITGEAGIGKTTLAKNLLLSYVAEGYELLAIGEKINEAEAAFRKNAKQIFYFDDFLGSNYLDAISGAAGTQIGQFIRRIRADSTKRFVLTSRTTILNQGKIYIASLTDQNLQKDEFEISLQSLSPLDKAKILYNHIWHSGLEADFKEQIYAERRYRIVVDHKNFNPRIISYVTDTQRLDGVAASSYWDHILSMLNNPSQVWSHPFDAQHDDYGRTLILLVALNGRQISQRDLSEAYYRFISRAGFSSLRGQRDFLTNLRHLCGSMLNRSLNGGSESLSLFNPSIRDFILSRYSRDEATLRDIFRALRTDDSLFSLRGFSNNAVVVENFTGDLLRSIALEANAADYVDYTPSYVARLYLFLDDVVDKSVLASLPFRNATEFVEREDLPSYFEEVLQFFALAKNMSIDVPRSPGRLIEQGCDRYPTTHELELLAELVPAALRGAVAATKFIESVTAVLKDQAEDEFPAHDVFAGMAWHDHWPSARKQLKGLIAARLESFDIVGDDKMIDEIADMYDVDSQAEAFFAGHDGDESRESGLWTEDSMDDVDDLFDRS